MRLFKTSILWFVFLVFPGLILAQGNTDVFYNRHADYYNLGREALKNEDYIEALKNLFVFRELAKDSLEKHPEFRKKINKSLAFAENQIRSRLNIFQGFAEMDTSGYGRFENHAREFDPDLMSKQIELLQLQIQLEKLKNQ